MTRIRAGSILALAVASVSTAAFGQVLHTGNTGNYGTPYATVGLGGANTWDMYRKQGSWAAGAPNVSGSNVSGNNTEFALTGQALGGAGWATGQLFVGTTNATTPASDLLYLQDLTVPGGTTANGYDANSHGIMDIRVGFITSPSAMVTSFGGDNGPEDLNTGNRGSNGVYLHLAASNVGATTAGGTGNAWTASYNGGFYAFNATSPQENNGLSASSTPTQTLVTSGTAITNNGTGAAYSAPLELSSKMFADPVTSGNVVLQVKMGNQLLSSSFNPNASVFGAGGFAWQTAKPVVFVGKASWDNLNTNATLHMGVLGAGDANGDGKVSAADTNALLANFGGTDKTWSQGDFTQDGKVKAADTNVLLANFGTHYNGPLAAPLTIMGPVAGPAAGKVDLVVNVITGDVQLVGGAGANTNNYEIDSDSGALDPTKWNKHAGWTTALGTATGISEFASGGLSQDLNSSSYDLGNIFKVGSAQDLSITGNIFNSSFQDVGGTVTYVPEPTALCVLGLGFAGLMVRRRKA